MKPIIIQFLFANNCCFQRAINQQIIKDHHALKRSANSFEINLLYPIFVIKIRYLAMNYLSESSQISV